MWPHSLRWRFQIWQACLLASLLGGFGLVVWTDEKTTALHRLDQELARKAADLAERVRGQPPEGRNPSEPPPEGPPGQPPESRGRGDGNRPPPPRNRRGPHEEPPLFPQPLTEETKRRVFALIDSMEQQTPGLFAGAYFKRTDEWLHRDPKVIAGAIPPRKGRDARGHFITRGTDRMFYSYTEMGDAVLVGNTLAVIETETASFLSKLILIASITFAVGLAGSWWLIDQSLRPIHRISRSARKVAEGNLSERIDIQSPESEIGNLASILNTTFSQLEASFERQKRFVSDASHELRTPLTVLITTNQAALSKGRTSEEYRETVEENLETAKQMKRLAESLLELARLDANEIRTGRIPFEISEVVKGCVAKLQIVAREKGIRIVEHAEAGIVVLASPVRIGLVVTNLIENAIHYTDAEGTVEVAVYTEDDRCIIQVKDDGCGIEPDHLAHIFERFYRTDPSRNRGTGRYGLGLTICKAVAEAEGGSIRVTSQYGKGSTFEVVLPCEAKQAGDF